MISLAPFLIGDKRVALSRSILEPVYEVSTKLIVNPKTHFAISISGYKKVSRLSRRLLGVS